MKDLSSIVAKFKVQGTIEEIKPLGTGLPVFITRLLRSFRLLGQPIPVGMN